MISKRIIDSTIKALTDKYPHESERIKVGVKQVSILWRREDGSEEEFRKFCMDNFAVEPTLSMIFERYNTKYEYLKGYLTALLLRLRLELDEDTGDMLNIDRYFSTLNPASHLNEDLFKTKIGFVVLLNFKLDTLSKTIANSERMSRKEWAINRMTKQFEGRVPSEVSQILTNVYSKASEFVYSYNIPIKKILYVDDTEIFNEDLNLITHWGLRDQIKIYYGKNSDINLKKQKTITKLMERIIEGLFPHQEMKRDDFRYNPYTNRLNGKEVKKPSYERYSHLKNIYLAHRKEDKYHILYKDYISRVFEGGREIPFERIEEIFIEILTDKNAFKIAELIKKKTAREMEVFDIWYNQFITRPDGVDLDEEVKKKYPTIDDFQNGIREILIKLDFDKDTAEYVAEKIEVDPARGAGHAWGPEMRGEKAHLRTRVIDKKYMNWQAFNTAMHELGHCVEQIFTLYDVDYNLLSGVPNTAFTEAMAFIFQNKALEILGIKKYDDDKDLRIIQTYWDTREITGVALVDMYVWKWMYKKKNFTERQLRDKVIEIAIEIWNRFYSPIFKIKDTPILAIYSHMIFHGLYLPDYPLGHIIAYLIEKHFEKVPIGKDMKRICQLGCITPLRWIKEAISQDLSVKPLLKDTKDALERVMSKDKEMV